MCQDRRACAEVAEARAQGGRRGWRDGSRNLGVVWEAVPKRKEAQNARANSAVTGCETLSGVGVVEANYIRTCGHPIFALGL